MPGRRESDGIYAGLMSGTSMDGIDAALVSFGEQSCTVIHAISTPYPAPLRSALLHASRQPEQCTVDIVGELDQWVGECFRDATLALLDKAGVPASDVVAIGSHGQTLRHQPQADRPFTLQIGNPNIIAGGTGITTVADLRRADVVHGGEGAPLAPAFHQWLLAHTTRNRAILNIGGFANLSLLPAGNSSTTGFDTGPGNTLLDTLAREHLDQPFDAGGAWASTGKVCEGLLQTMLADPYFKQEPPKSTGFEYFNAGWLTVQLAAHTAVDLAPVDIQATLAELTAQSIATAIAEHLADVEEVFICGGGVHNKDLVQRITRLLAPARVGSTADCGLDPDWVEAAAFAWLAKRRLEGKPGNLPSVTGARRPAVLGAIYLPPE